MIELNNITLADYYNLDNKDEYDFVLKYIMPKDVYNAGDFTQLQFGLIKELQQSISDGVTWSELISYITRITKKKAIALGKHKLIGIARFTSYIKSEIERINEIEIELLGHVATSEERQAGIESFNKFGNYAQLRTLAGNDITKIKEIEKMKYTECLLELSYQKVQADFQDRYYEVKFKKH